ncbi:hypothetical protein [Paenibacillus sp. FSL E2-0178]|uniref:hypothetical protein n=1 Tax=Paenibacillus sp. FSL E2-0178 TaxID=2921361 RepID=UPI00315948AD
MKLEQAEKIVNAYGAALSSGKEGEMARRMSLLPCDKETIIKANKIYIAYLIRYKIINDKIMDALIVSLSGIGSFIEDNRANQINKSIQLYKSGEYDEYVNSKEYSEFLQGIVNINMIEDVQEFIETVYGFDDDDPLYFQRVCTLAGVEYIAERTNRRSFWKTLFKR